MPVSTLRPGVPDVTGSGGTTIPGANVSGNQAPLPTGSQPNPLLPTFPSGQNLAAFPANLGAPGQSVPSPILPGLATPPGTDLAGGLRGAMYPAGVAQALASFLQSGAGYNPQVAQALIAQMQPDINRGAAQLQEQFGASGLSQSSPYAIGLADYLSRVQLNEGQIMAQLYENAVTTYADILSGARTPTQPSALSLIASLLGGASPLLSTLINKLWPSASTPQPGVVSSVPNIAGMQDPNLILQSLGLGAPAVAGAAGAGAGTAGEAAGVGAGITSGIEGLSPVTPGASAIAPFDAAAAAAATGAGAAAAAPIAASAVPSASLVSASSPDIGPISSTFTPGAVDTTGGAAAGGLGGVAGVAATVGTVAAAALPLILGNLAWPAELAQWENYMKAWYTADPAGFMAAAQSSSINAMSASPAASGAMGSAEMQQIAAAIAQLQAHPGSGGSIWSGNMGTSGPVAGA